MEHESIMVKPPQIPHGVGLLCRQEVVERANASRRVDPLLSRAAAGVAVEVDPRRPPAVDLDAGETVLGLLGDVGPHVVLLVAEHGPAVVSDALGETRVVPGSQGVSVVQAGDGRGDEAVRGEVARTDPGLGEPELVPFDLLDDVCVRGVVLVFVGEGVADGEEVLDVRVEPSLQGVQVQAREGVVVRVWRERPDVGACSQRLLELQRGVGLAIVLDGVGRARLIALISSLGLFDVAVTVEPDFDGPVAPCRHNGPDRRYPADNSSQVVRGYTIGGSIGGIQVGLEEHVIDLSVQVDTTVTCVQAPRDPGDVGVLEDRRGCRPVLREINEEDHLLSARLELVDDTCSAVGCEAAVACGPKFSNGSCGCRV